MSRPRRVLITGGVRRLGLHIAFGFAERGAELGLIYHASSDRDAEAAREQCLERGAQRVELIKGDIVQHAHELVERFAFIFGGIDVLVNNAGVMPARHSTEDLTAEQFSQTLGLNLLAPFNCAQAAVHYMERGSAIVNLASLGGVQIWKERIDYNVSKSALITLTKALARDLAPQGITVNAVAPGAIQVENESAERMGIKAEKIPMGSYGTPADIARAVTFFACDAPYVTGQTLIVDGGRSVVG